MIRNVNVQTPFQDNKVLIYLLVATVFLDGLLLRGAVGFDLYYYYAIFILGILVCIFKKSAIGVGPPWFGRFLLWFFILNLITGILMGTIGFLMYKQMIGIVFSATAYWCIYILAGGDIYNISKTYLTIAYYESLSGLIFLVFAIAGVNEFGVMRLQGIVQGFPRIIGTTAEPYFLAVSLIPAVFIYLNMLFKRKDLGIIANARVKGMITLTCYILTGASSGYLALFFMLLFLAYNFKILSFNIGIILLPLFVLIGIVLFNFFSTNATGFNKRVNDTFYAIESDESANKKATKINASSFALYSNFKVALETLKINPITGSGLGTHEINYNTYIRNSFTKIIFRRFGGEMNKQDANSLFIRLMSETGLLGVILFLAFMIVHFPAGLNADKLEPKMYFLYLFHQGIFILFIIRLLRTGNYIGNGFFFFLFAYIYTYKKLKPFITSRLGKKKKVKLPFAVRDHPHPSVSL